MPEPLQLRPAAWRARPLLVFISDVHLTDELGVAPVPWDQVFERFWQRIEGARGDGPAELCIVGDFVDLVRSPMWLRTESRPYHLPDGPVLEVVDRIVAATLEREAAFFAAMRTRVQAGTLVLHYVLGNHDRLLEHAPAARRRLWKAMTGRDETWCSRSASRSPGTEWWRFTGIAATLSAAVRTSGRPCRTSSGVS